MKFSIAAIFAVAVIAVSAQMDGLPTCATACAQTGLMSTGCSMTDIKCICSNQKFIMSISGCIATACNAADQQTTLGFAVKLCQGAGAPIPSSVLDSLTASHTSTATATSTKTSTTVKTAVKTASASAAASSTEEAATSTEEASASSTEESSATTTEASTPAATTSIHAAVSSAVHSNDASARLGVSGVMGAVGAAAAMFLL